MSVQYLVTWSPSRSLRSANQSGHVRLMFGDHEPEMDGIGGSGVRIKSKGTLTSLRWFKVTMQRLGCTFFIRLCPMFRIWWYSAGVQTLRSQLGGRRGVLFANSGVELVFSAAKTLTNHNTTIIEYSAIPRTDQTTPPRGIKLIKALRKMVQNPLL